MRRLLAVRQDNNGDVILAGPAVRALARHGEVTLVCGPSGEGAARLLPGVSRTVVFRADWIEGEPRPIEPNAIEAFVATVRRMRFDDGVIFTSFHQSPLPTALLLRLAGVTRVHAISDDYPGALLDTRARVPDDIHEVERALRLVAAAGFPFGRGDDALQLLPLPDTRALTGEDYVAVQPGATVAARRWDPVKLRSLVARLASAMRVAVLGSAGERDLVRFVCGDAPALDLAGRTSFAEFAGVIARARALVIANSAGIHVAGATGTPVVTIFPPTILPARFLPWRVPFVALGDHDIPCAGCRARVCPIPGQPCIGNITVEEVEAALTRLVPRGPVISPAVVR